MDTARLLLVEPETATRRLLDARLRGAGFRSVAVDSAELALGALSAECFAVLITDMWLHHNDAIELLQKARAFDPELELIVLTDAPTMDSAIEALNVGVYAYLRKPTRPGELETCLTGAISRRRSRIERSLVLRQLRTLLLRVAEPEAPFMLGTPEESLLLRIGGLEIDPLRRRVAISQRAVPLSCGEFDLLLYMARRDNQVLSAEELMREALGCPACSSNEARELIKARIHRLRQKLEAEPHSQRFIVSVRGAGYMLTAEH